METKAHYVLIGAFTLLMIAAGFGLVLFFSGAGALSPRRTYEIIFQGPVSGLARGSAVTFSGLRVGEVTWVDLDEKDPRRVIAYFQIFRNLALHADVKAQLESQGLTGNSVIALSGGSPGSPAIKGEYGEAPIQGESSSIQSLLSRVESISVKADAVIAKVDKLLDDNGDSITDTLKNVDTFSKALSSNADGLKDSLASIADLAQHAKPLADRLTKLTDTADQILKGVSPAQVGHIVDNVSKFTDAVTERQEDVKALISESASFAKRLNDASANLGDTVANVRDIVKAVDPKQVASLMKGADALGATIDENRGNIDRAIKNTSELSAKLDEAADKLDPILDNVKGLLESADVKGPLAKVGDAAASIQRLSDDLDERIKSISGGLTRFSNYGLRQYEALAIDARQTLGDVDKFVKSLSENPSQIIFGAKKK